MKWTHEIKDEDFWALQEHPVVVVDFYGADCGPCKLLGPIIEKLAAENIGRIPIWKAEIEAAPEAFKQYNIRIMPTIVFFKDGKEVERLIGMQPRSKLQERINTLLT